ncbi:unnamed protein product [Periconia digitata]|uniref:C2H2-type domain-containing protein n=1 Tax=Periconia digitata TaxID=1303443 RepID=A0A9W4UD61_9PLEO|nr:unnamed protein product [Periconia digitata]
MTDKLYSGHQEGAWQREIWDDTAFAKNYQYETSHQPQGYGSQNIYYNGAVRGYAGQIQGYSPDMFGSFGDNAYMSSYTQDCSYTAYATPSQQHQDTGPERYHHSFSNSAGQQQSPVTYTQNLEHPAVRTSSSEQTTSTPISTDWSTEPSQSITTASAGNITYSQPLPPPHQHQPPEQTTPLASLAPLTPPTPNTTTAMYSHFVQCKCGEILRGPHANGNLTRHRRSRKCTVPGEKRVLLCDKCDTQFQRSDALLNHKRKKHNAPPGTPRALQMDNGGS